MDWSRFKNVMAGPVGSSLEGAAGIRLPSYLLFWTLGFAYACLMALLLQKILLPLMPSLHAGHGLMNNDAVVFHDMAAQAAERIHAHGWSEWKLFPGAGGNVGILSAIYALLGPDPIWFIPFTAAAHAAGATLIYRMGGRIWPGHAGQLGGLIAGIVFLAFPSALQWYGQNHKDAFAIAGTLLVLDAWLELHASQNMIRPGRGRAIFRAIWGMVLIGVVRPYFTLPVSCGIGASFLVTGWSDLMGRRSTPPHEYLSRVVMVGLVVALTIVFVQMGAQTGVGDYLFADGRVHLTTFDHVDSWKWNTSTVLPVRVDDVLRRASELRAHFVLFGRSVGAGSEIDGDRLPTDALAAVSYFPRAVVVGLFAPFPESWVERVSPIRLIGAVETAIWYGFILGAIWMIVFNPTRPLVAGAVFGGALLLMLAYIHPNVGTLYRQRFGVWLFFLLCGAVGWARVFLALLEQRVSDHGLTAQAADAGRSGSVGTVSTVDRVAASGAVVMLVTLLCYLGFFARDLLLVQRMGMTDSLDAFFTAAMIPMFFVTFLAMPMADALMLPFLSSGVGNPEQRALLIRHTLGFALLLLGLTALIVVATAPWLITLVLGGQGAAQFDQAVVMLRWFAPIVLLSAWTVVGNAALNALGRSRDAALGQLVVPAVTITALIWVPPPQAATAALGGMLAGTMLNVYWVRRALQPLGIPLRPAMPRVHVLHAVTSSYHRLAGAALLTAALVPLNYAFAAGVASGSVSAWALASKIVALFSGLASVGASAVVS